MKYSSIDYVEQDFETRLLNYKSKVLQLVRSQIGKNLISTDQLIYFTYAGFGSAEIKCEDLKKMSSNQIIEATSFSINSSYTFVLDNNGDYKATVWHNGIYENPSIMENYAKEKAIIEEYRNKQYALMFQYSNCDYVDYIFGYKSNAELQIYKVNEESIEPIVRDSLM